MSGMKEVGSLFYCDGSCDPNPYGHGGWGWLLKEDGSVLADDYGFAGYGDVMSNNVAEFIALIEALAWAVNYRSNSSCHFFMDSDLVVKVVNNVWRAKKPHIRYLRNQAQGLLRQLRSSSISWIPRHQNFEADVLSHQFKQTQFDSTYVHPYAKISINSGHIQSNFGF